MKEVLRLNREFSFVATRSTGGHEIESAEARNSIQQKYTLLDGNVSSSRVEGTRIALLLTRRPQVEDGAEDRMYHY